MCFIEYVFTFLLCGTCSLAPNDEFQAEFHCRASAKRHAVSHELYCNQQIMLRAGVILDYFGLYSD